MPAGAARASSRSPRPASSFLRSRLAVWTRTSDAFGAWLVSIGVASTLSCAVDELPLRRQAWMVRTNHSNVVGELVDSIAFPAISTGVYRFPVERAARIAVAATREALAAHPAIERVVFACFGAASAAAHRAALRA